MQTDLSRLEMKLVKCVTGVHQGVILIPLIFLLIFFPDYILENATRFRFKYIENKSNLSVKNIIIFFSDRVFIGFLFPYDCYFIIWFRKQWASVLMRISAF